MLPACVPFIGSAALLIRRRRVSAAPQLLVQAVSLRSGADMSALWSWWKAETKHVGAMKSQSRHWLRPRALRCAR
jgi:hypothetical protein